MLFSVMMVYKYWDCKSFATIERDYITDKWCNSYHARGFGVLCRFQGIRLGSQGLPIACKYSPTQAPKEN